MTIFDSNDSPFEEIIGDKKIKLRGSEDLHWVRVEYVVRTVDGLPLYLVDGDGLIYPWHAIDLITPFGK